MGSWQSIYPHHLPNYSRIPAPGKNILGILGTLKKKKIPPKFSLSLTSIYHTSQTHNHVTLLSLSTPFNPSTFSSPCSSSCESYSTFFASKISCFCPSGSIKKTIRPICVKTHSLRSRRSNRDIELKSRYFISESRRFKAVKSRKMTITEYREEKKPLLETEMNSRPKRIALFVEPSPFSYVSGYKNRFQNFIKYLREMGDEVLVVTTDEGVPQEFYGAHLIGSRSFPCPYYEKVPLSLALSPRIISAVAQFKPNIIHASSPGIMVFGALAIAKFLSVPIVMSYHTHVPVAADLTLVPSAAIGKDLEAANVTSANRIRIWNKGVDSESFHPRFVSLEMRSRLSNGETDRPLIVHVGRLGVEKSLDFLKSVMDRLPEARIAFIGDGPYR